MEQVAMSIWSIISGNLLDLLIFTAVYIVSDNKFKKTIIFCSVLFFFGANMNRLVMFYNDGNMPVLGFDHVERHWVPLNSEHRLQALADIHYVCLGCSNDSKVFQAWISKGDMLVFLGIIILGGCLAFSLTKPLQNKDKTDAPS